MFISFFFHSLKQDYNQRDKITFETFVDNIQNDKIDFSDCWNIATEGLPNPVQPSNKKFEF